jgi:small subunit ribosomal protein S9
MADIKQTERYAQTVGRRKTSVATARLTPAGKHTMTINDRDVANYFPTRELQTIVTEALKLAGEGKFKVTIKVNGGGVHSQAEAVRHAIARAIVETDHSLRKPAKQAGFLKRDPRAKERRKFGLKKARKAPQWSKR